MIVSSWNSWYPDMFRWIHRFKIILLDCKQFSDQDQKIINNKKPWKEKFVEFETEIQMSKYYNYITKDADK